MEGGALFNPGFLGGNFLWWVGQVADDSTWRENVIESKHQSSSDNSGWGYRYKVRIIGLHDKDESSIPSDQLPWAQVMYPITAGGGQGGSYQTPAIKQGMFVFGFFLDGQDQQVPVIMGVLGANAQIPKATQTALSGGSNFVSQSGHANSGSDPTKKVGDNDLVTERPSGTSPSGQPTGGNNPANPPTPNAAPTKESPAATHQETAADKRKDEVLKRKHYLWCPDPKKKSPMKGIQNTIEEVIKKIQKIQQAILDYVAAIQSDINVVNSLINQVNDIASLIKDASCEIAKFLKTLFSLVQDFITDLYSKVLKPLLKNAPPTIKIEILDKLIKGLEIIDCIFNKIGLSLCDSAEAALKNSFARRSAQSPPPADAQPFLTDQFRDIPWFPNEGYYNPTPMCYVEELVGEILGENLNDIVQGFDAAVLPVAKDIQNSLDGLGTNEGTSGAGSSGTPVPSSSGGNLIPNIPNLPSIPNLGALGALGGGGFDIGAALSFISAITGIFSCDILPKCSPNETHTLQEGGSGKPSTDEPSNVGVAKAAQARASAPNRDPLARAGFDPRYDTPGG